MHINNAGTVQMYLGKHELFGSNVQVIATRITEKCCQSLCCMTRKFTQTVTATVGQGAYKGNKSLVGELATVMLCYKLTPPPLKKKKKERMVKYL
jgi:hypothetical protein